MTGKFLPVSLSKLPILQSTIAKRLPKSATFYNIVTLYLKGRYSRNVCTTFYAYDEVVDNEHGLYVAVQRRKVATDHDSAVTLSAHSSDLSSLTTGIVKAFENVLDWKSLPICFCSVDEELVKHIQLAEMCSRNGKLEDIDPCHFYYMNIEDALKLDTTPRSSDVKVSRLSPMDAKKVTDYWKFSGVGTLERMVDSISTLESGGVYVQLPESNQMELASWVVTSHVGSINALYTDEKYRRRGFARLTMNACSKYNAKDNLMPNVQIQLFNEPSKLLMEQLGFVYSHQINWVIFRPAES